MRSILITLVCLRHLSVMLCLNSDLGSNSYRVSSAALLVRVHAASTAAVAEGMTAVEGEVDSRGENTPACVFNVALLILPRFPIAMSDRCCGELSICIGDAGDGEGEDAPCPTTLMRRFMMGGCGDGV